MKVPLILGLVGVLISALPRAGRGQEDISDTARFVRIGHYQCVCKQGDFAANLGTVIQGLQLAQAARLDIVSFPESLLTGYYSTEEDARQHSFAIDSPEMKRVLEQTASFDSLFMVGFNERRGEKLYNTVAVMEKGKLLGRYSKAMPIFPYFTPGREFPVFERNGLKFGVVICADGGFIEPTRILALKGARLIFAPHFNFVGDPIQHYQMVRNDHIARAIENGVYFLRANNVVPTRTLEGMRGEGFGYGDSYLLNPHGEVVAAAGLYQQYLMIYNLDLQQQYRNRPIWRSRKSAAELLDTLREVLQQSEER